jgi:hypothetical protein
MPVVLRWHGFSVMVYSHDHTDRAHVHVCRGEHTVVINLPTSTRRQTVREVGRMRRTDIRRAYELVAEHADFLLQEWRRIHGEAGTG